MKNFRNTISNKLNEAYMCPIIIGIFLILVGLFIQVPGGALTTYKFLDGDKAEDYVFDDKYSSIDEYVGGDAYNYIIGASLVAGEISGVITAKAIFVVGGALCLCLGITLKMLQKKKRISKSFSEAYREIQQDQAEKSTYERLLKVVEIGTGTKNIDDVISRFSTFYVNKGKDIPKNLYLEIDHLSDQKKTKIY